ncbi:MAG: nucleoside triphosphate pyrophosphohydrolase [Bacteroidaceae bacterium]|nr:nucleoside triphosphate pyrophosphohydrolase [Bacteroidaceae bacterium]
MNSRDDKLQAFGRLLDVLDKLRVECPWDRKQTNQSLRQNTIEETYELADAILADDVMNIKKELGDVLLHVCFYSKIADEKGQFDIADVCNQLCDKLIFRHPHVYPPAGGSSQDNLTSEQVLQNWEQIKQKEKDGNKTVLSGVPNSLSSIIKAYRIQEKASNVGFDWEKKEDVWAKVKEEISEFEQAIGTSNAEEEMGDVMFSLINVSRLYKIYPDNALEQANQKFIRRFNYIEEKAKQQNKLMKDMTLEEMDALWNEAKQVLK